MRYDDDWEDDFDGAMEGLYEAPPEEKPVYKPMSWFNYWCLIVGTVVLVIMRFACG